MAATASSNTSSRTSTRSSTSDGPVAVVGGLVRLAHPFPSLLDGLVVGGGRPDRRGDPSTAARLGVSMTALQASIGTVNDIVDAPRDAGRKPGKPIPAGLVSRDRGAAVVIVRGGSGTRPRLCRRGRRPGCSASSSWRSATATTSVFKGTAWSWLPFAVGIPLLPVFGWVGAAGSLPSSFAVLVPAAVLAGAALAVANARADVERDWRPAPLGRDVGWATGLAASTRPCWRGVVAGRCGDPGRRRALGPSRRRRRPCDGGRRRRARRWAGARDPGRRERAWELEAVGVAAAGSRLAGRRGER